MCLRAMVSYVGVFLWANISYEGNVSMSEDVLWWNGSFREDILWREYFVERRCLLKGIFLLAKLFYEGNYIYLYFWAKVPNEMNISFSEDFVWAWWGECFCDEDFLWREYFYELMCLVKGVFFKRGCLVKVFFICCVLWSIITRVNQRHVKLSPPPLFLPRTAILQELLAYVSLVWYLILYI